MEEGVVPTHADPVKTDIKNNYTFIGWYPDVIAANGNASYTAQFTDDLIYYSVGDSLDFGSSTYVKGGSYSDPTHELSGSYTITSAAYDSENSRYNLVLRSADNTVSISTFGSDEYENFVISVYGYNTIDHPFQFEIVPLGTVIWKDEDGNILEKDENVPQGSKPSFDGDYSRESESPDDYY